MELSRHMGTASRAGRWDSLVSQSAARTEQTSNPFTARIAFQAGRMGILTTRMLSTRRDVFRRHRFDAVAASRIVVIPGRLGLRSFLYCTTTQRSSCSPD